MNPPTFEARRLRQKTLQNHIGKLHEIAISCFDGWQLSETTADVENKDLKIIAEIKNKHNTMNSSSALATYDKLEHLVDGAYSGYQSYVVQIIPRHTARPYSLNYSPSDSKKTQAKSRPSRQDIKIIDGESFYALANKGNVNTIYLVYEIMANLLMKHMGKSAKKASSTTGYIDFINAIRPSLRK